MHSIVVFFRKPGFYDEPFDDPSYVSAYTDLARAITDRGARFCIARDQATFLGKQLFRGGWIFTDGKFKRTEDIIDADVIYNKDNTFVTKPESNIINQRELEEICCDKAKTYRLFPDLFPKTAVARSPLALEAALRAVPGDKIVLKPLSGHGGKGVEVVAKREVRDASEYAYPLLIQQFIDTSGGIPGITDSLHDLRMIVMNGELLNCTLRIPAQGKFLSNVSQGGRVLPLSVDQCPTEARALIEPVEAVMQKFGNRLYSIDYGRDASGKWLLIELNDQPGVWARDEIGAEAERYFRAFANFLIHSAGHPTPASTSVKTV